jgi:hypothetical protein
MMPRYVWPHLSRLEQVLYVVFFPCVLIAFAGFWMVLGTPAAFRKGTK